MRVNSYTLSDDGSNLYRIKLPAQALKAQGMDIEYLKTGGETRDADVLVFSRPASKTAVEVIANLAEAGYAVVVDIDDLFSHVRTGHAMYGDSADRAHGYLKWACKFATLVTATTQPIADEYGGDRGRVIPNYIPESYLRVAKPNVHTKLPRGGDRGRVIPNYIPESYLRIAKPNVHTKLPRVGWSGTVSSHPNDLQEAGTAIKRLEQSKACRVAFVGPHEEAPKVRKALSLYRNPASTGWQTFENYPHALAQLDVGLVPLEGCLFNDAKSWLKGLEMAAVGVPFVASPTPEYRRLFGLGAGKLASRPNEWRRLVTDLLIPSYREDAIHWGREAARKLTIEGNCDRWAEVFTEANSLRSARAVL